MSCISWDRAGHVAGVHPRRGTPQTLMPGLGLGKCRLPSFGVGALRFLEAGALSLPLGRREGERWLMPLATW